MSFFQPCVVAVATILMFAHHAAAQTTISVRVGGGTGSTDQAIASGQIRTQILPYLLGAAEVTVLGGSPGGCEQEWPMSFRCSFSGTSAMLGAHLAPLQSGRLYTGFSANAGRFSRGHNRSEGDHNSFAWSVGADAAVRLSRRFSVEAAFRRTRIRDEAFRTYFFEYPTVKSLVVGIGFGL